MHHGTGHMVGVLPMSHNWKHVRFPNGLYASYWNAFLFELFLSTHIQLLSFHEEGTLDQSRTTYNF